ncbi:PREDICTED: APC membrane recruitment protein 1 [Nanorana parkeri]|uniref:APC membrane recruitment protein 1 n=1 Tax=Nanorana parkeri TaxID=125878 RepID=UPI0008544FE0|nr:PREDICTED: APC membrane recruitment protein 1 [Nanorana parkeri]
METGRSCQEKNARKSSSICAKQDEGHNDGECPKVDVHSTQSCMEQQTQGKQKKTPFKFFGGKRSIVTLPSFFGGKHKGLGKGNARKSMSKSKTHDGISDVPGDDGKKGCSDHSINRHHGHDLCKTGNILPSSLSADSGITSPVKLDFSFHDISPMGSTECFEKKMNGEKSFSFPRPKKGLKGLFSSIRRHKKNKTPDPDKCERYDHITETVILEQLNKYPSEDAELQCSSEQPKRRSEESVPTDCLRNLTIVCENEEETQQGSVSPPNLTPQKSKEFVVEANEGLPNDQNPVTISKPDCLTDSSVPEVSSDVLNTDLDRESSLNSAGDHLSLMFEDVSSLKSFDSLTGCGDIIAEQDIDNISDTSLSLERSRETTKRSSCLVTYQGGGEEMATPDDMEEEYLQRLLEDGNEVDASYELEEKVHEEMSKGYTELQPHAYSVGAEDAFVDRTVLSSAELLTPQSDHQVSAPNSDEGYYDSTTPGPDDDGGERFSHKERLPRDSYSGDALYEFYEPDDSLMSPAPGGESLYESKTLCSEIFDHFFDFNLPINSGLSQDGERKKGATETEEERLAVIQKQLLFWEMQREAALKGLGHINKDTFSKENQIECDIRAVHLLGRSKGCLTREQNVSKDVGDKGMQHTETGKQTWKDHQETPLPDSDYHRSYIHHVDGNGLVENPGFELNVGSFEARDQSDTKLATTPKLSNSSISPMHHVHNVFSSEFTCLSNYSAENECEQAVDFADNGMLFSSISERLGGAGSSTSFHHNLNALPTMITFDVVDFENEGECEQQVDLSPDGEVVSSFETFDHSYVQESLAECDEHLLQMDSHQSFNNYTWGVTSLPRHLEQYKLSPFKPVPLSVNRRSKSLDTESLELELGGIHMSKSGLKSYDLLTPWEDRKNSSQCEDRCANGDKARFNGCKMLGQIVLANEKSEAYTPVLSPKQGYNRELLGSNTSSQLPLDRREIGNTTTETVQYNTRQPQEDSKSCRYSRDNTTKKLARVLPLEEQRGVDTQFKCDYDAAYKQIKTKPVGVTQAMPQQHKKDYYLQLDFVERSGPSKKGILEHRDTSPIDWSNNYSECSNG